MRQRLVSLLTQRPVLVALLFVLGTLASTGVASASAVQTHSPQTRIKAQLTIEQVNNTQNGVSLGLHGTGFQLPPGAVQEIVFKAVSDAGGDLMVNPHDIFVQGDEFKQTVTVSCASGSGATITASGARADGSAHFTCAGTGGVTVLPINVNDILNAHNRYRTEVGDPPLQWSNAVAQSALNWAKTMASTAHKCAHSSGSGYGENCAEGTAGYFSPTQLIDIEWGAEKSNFIPGCTFEGKTSNDPCSKTGNWQAIGHYTQVVWRNTKEVGCGFVSDGQKDFLVCQYNPPGNWAGQKVY